MLEQDSKIAEIASEYFACNLECFNGVHTCRNALLIMARGYNYATCLEGSLKLKELVNMHSEGKTHTRIFELSIFVLLIQPCLYVLMEFYI